MSEYSTEEVRIAEREATEIVRVVRASPDPRNRVVLIATVGAVIFVLLLLLIPRDILTPPAPSGTPQIVLGVMGLIACVSWALNPKRRYQRFAVVLIALAVLPTSPLWYVAFHITGFSPVSTSLPSVTQVAMVVIAYLCLWLDYCAHRDQCTIQNSVQRALEIRVFARRTSMLASEQSERALLEFIEQFKRNKKKIEHNGVIAAVMLACVGSALAVFASVKLEWTGSLPPILSFDASPANISTNVSIDASVEDTTVDTPVEDALEDALVVDALALPKEQLNLAPHPKPKYEWACLVDITHSCVCVGKAESVAFDQAPNTIYIGIIIHPFPEETVINVLGGGRQQIVTLKAGQQSFVVHMIAKTTEAESTVSASLYKSGCNRSEGDDPSCRVRIASCQPQ